MTRSLALVAVVGLALTGCDASSVDDGRAPTPIASAAFDLNDDAFPDANARVAAGENYLNAAGRVALVTTIVGLNLALPVAATDAATRDQPTVTNGVWTWEATVDVFGTPVDLALEGDADGSEVDWRLVATRQGATPGDPFTYYTASTSLDGRTGSWRLFNPDASGPVLTADFDVRDLDDRVVTFRVPEGRANGGSSVRYATDGEEQTFDWTDQPENDRALIVWNLDTRAGSITADTYNGGRRACWDEDLADVGC